MSNMDGKNSKVFLFWLCVKQNIYINNVEQYFILMGQLGEKIYNNSLTCEVSEIICGLINTNPNIGFTTYF